MSNDIVHSPGRQADPPDSPQRVCYRELLLCAIRLDGDTQPRARQDTGLIREYADLYEAGVSMPPMDVFFDGVDYWLADGFHRWFGARDTKRIKLACKVHTGTRDDARWFSYAANQAHGQRRNNEDKRKAVLSALQHPKGAAASDSQIGDYLGISHSTVAKYRAELEATCQIGKSESRTGRDGRTINVAK
jgi:hypothetical protein